MQVILYDTEIWDELLPLTFTRPVAKIRMGILTLSEKWKKYLALPVSFCTREHLKKLYPLALSDDNLVINSALLPAQNMVSKLLSLKQGEAYFQKEIFIAGRFTNVQFNSFTQNTWKPVEIEFSATPHLIKHFCDIFSYNGDELLKDFELLTAERKSEPLPKSNRIIGNPGLVFIEKGASIECSILNTTAGPIYIGKDAEIMEGSVIRGPFAICEHATVKMSAKIYGATTIGPYSKVGGEINNSVFFGFSNKAHDGFLGNSVIGEWCNLGADTNNSNLKNNYAEVKMWNYPKKRFVSTGLQFAGLIMGDHSKCGINTMFNTGTVIGVSCNLFGDGFHRNFVPSFSWGGAQGYTNYQFEKAVETAKLVLQRRNIELGQDEMDILEWIYKYTEPYRNL
jgi:UDP-N-acetylglucosamine diphosphorylase/glucosamine-1-phosphate N-acetyltransferase